MTRRRSNRKKEEGASDSVSSSSSESAPQEKNCLQGVKKLVGMYTPVRKGNSNMSVMRTPGSGLKRMGVPSRNFPSTPKGVSRPGTQGLTPWREREQDPIQVFCRVKPYDGEGACLQIRSETEVALVPPDNPVYWRQNQAKEGYYQFSRVFDESAGQKAVFKEVAMPLLQDFIEGKNALLFAYGVTSSGKTYTMTGNAGELGIMPRCLDIIFNTIAPYKATKYVFKPDRLNGFESQSKADAMQERQKEIIEKAREAGRTGTPRTRARNPANDAENFANRERDETVLDMKDKDSFYSVFITHIEIYNNFVYDLLDESPIDIGKKNGLQSKMLREDVNHNVYVNGVTEVEVESPAEAFEVFQRGLRRRRIAHTALNTESSRSHSVFNIRLVRAASDSEGEEVTDNKEHILVSQLSLVDLAGSERYSRTQATGDRLKEAGNINNSLMTLRKCMEILRENQTTGGNQIVPFRNSKITHFLKNYFEGEGRVRMILCVNPRPDDYDENFHVLSFAEQAQEVQITRPQEKKVVMEMQTPGRVKANELYKETVRHMVADGVVEEGVLPKTDTQFVFHNLPIPVCHITKSNEAEVLATLRKALEMRLTGCEQLRKTIAEKQNAFRRLLLDMDHENQTLVHENASMKVQIQSLNDDKSRNEIVLRQMMQEKKDVEEKCDEQEKLIHQMEEELADLRMQFRQRDVQHYKEKQMLRSDLDLQRELDDLKRKRALQREEEKMKKEFKQKDKTLAAVRQLVSSVDLPASASRSSRSRHRSIGFLEESMSTSTSSEPDLTSVVAKENKKRTRAPSAPLLHLDSGTPLSSIQLKKNLGIPSRTRQRTRSTDQDVWVEHTAGVALKEGTVFQPYMKKKKSVTKLTKADDIPANASKYCLRTQEQDSEGEVETKLYKGDVLTTVGGGTQVIFNDVEVLRQESPTAPTTSPTRKRRSSGILGIVSSSPFRSMGDVEDLQDRCRQGVGSSIISKRSRQN